MEEKEQKTCRRKGKEAPRVRKEKKE